MRKIYCAVDTLINRLICYYALFKSRSCLLIVNTRWLLNLEEKKEIYAMFYSFFIYFIATVIKKTKK